MGLPVYYRKVLPVCFIITGTVVCLEMSFPSWKNFMGFTQKSPAAPEIPLRLPVLPIDEIPVSLPFANQYSPSLRYRYRVLSSSTPVDDILLEPVSITSIEHWSQNNWLNYLKSNTEAVWKGLINSMYFQYVVRSSVSLLLMTILVICSVALVYR